MCINELYKHQNRLKASKTFESIENVRNHRQRLDSKHRQPSSEDVE